MSVLEGGGVSSPSGTNIAGCLQGGFCVAVIPMTRCVQIFFCHENWKAAQEKKKKKKDSLFIYFSIIFSTLPRGITFTVARLNEFALFVTCRWVPWAQFVVHPMDSCTDDAEMERPYAISCFLGSV